MQCSINIKLKIYLISLSRVCFIVIRDVFVESDKKTENICPLDGDIQTKDSYSYPNSL